MPLLGLGEYSEPLVIDVLSDKSFSISGSFLDGPLRWLDELLAAKSCFFSIDLERWWVSGEPYPVSTSIESADADVLPPFLSASRKLVEISIVVENLLNLNL